MYGRLSSWLENYRKEEESRPLNLLALPTIPTPLEDDIVFSRYVCSITHEPVRDPVGDPNGHALYERAAIMEWLNRGNNRSPVTQQAMTSRDLIEKPILRRLIDRRLKYHEQRLWDYMQSRQNLQAGLNSPVEGELQAAVDRGKPSQLNL